MVRTKYVYDKDVAMQLTYPLAKNDIFHTIQGEGALLGTPMVFIRLAGCSIGCLQCDTDYKVHHRLTTKEIGERIVNEKLGAKWIWITGGEPTDHELWPLLEECRLCGHVALATSGVRSIGGGYNLVDFISVSPHSTPADLVISRGSQINLVPSLNGLKLADWHNFDASGFAHKIVTPPMINGEMLFVDECVEFINQHQEWRLGIQAHQFWRLP